MEYTTKIHELTLTENTQTRPLVAYVSYALVKVCFCGKEIDALEYLPGTEIFHVLSGTAIVRQWTGFSQIPQHQKSIDFSHNCFSFAFKDHCDRTAWINGLGTKDILHCDSPVRECSEAGATIFVLTKNQNIVHAGIITKGKFRSKIGCRTATDCDNIGDFKKDYDYNSVKYFQPAPTQSLVSAVGNWLNVGVKGSAIWPKEETTVDFGGHPLLLRPATKDTEQSIHVNLKGITDVEGLTLINRFLSILSWCDDASLENLYGGSGSPVPISVPKETRNVGSSIAFPFFRDVESDKKACLALALFREGATVNSLSFAFLSYFKILNIFWLDKFTGPKRQKQNPMIEGIKTTLPLLNDDLAVQRLKALAGSKPDMPEYLYKSGRCAIAHAFSNPIVDPDEVADLRRLSEDIHIIKAIAEHLIETKLHVSRSLMG